MIVRARSVVTMKGAPIENGAIVISGDRITSVGSFNEIKRSASGEVVDLGEQVLLPGLINAHCHLDYTAFRGRIAPNKSFTDWVQAINREKTKLTPDDYLSSIQAGLDEAAKFGTTSLINFEAFPQLISRARSSLRVWWLAELIDVRAPESAAQMIDAALDALNVTERRGLAPHSPFTASGVLYNRCQQLADRGELVLSTHLAESRDEMEMFREACGPLHDFLKSIGRNMSDCGKQTPLGRFIDVLCRQGFDQALPQLSRWIVAHLNELSDSDLDLLQQIKSKFHIVHCPRSHEYFQHEPFQFERLRQLGFNICLGTDSLASNDDLSLFVEMRAFQQRHPTISLRDVVEMVTVNPARALRQEHTGLGTIRGGASADLIAIPYNGCSDSFQAILDHSGPVSWTMTGGITARETPS